MTFSPFRSSRPGAVRALLITVVVLANLLTGAIDVAGQAVDGESTATETVETPTPTELPTQAVATETTTPTPEVGESPTSTATTTPGPSPEEPAEPTATPTNDIPLPTQATETATSPVATPDVVQADDETTGTMVVHKTAGGQPLGGACFSLVHGTDNVVGVACDGDDGADDGTLTLANVPPGAYSLVEYIVPPGYAESPRRTVTVTAGETLVVEVENALGQTLVITRVDIDGDPVPGGCYSMEPVVLGRTLHNCDASDETADGITTIVDLATGEFTLHEGGDPQGQSLPARRVTIVDGPNNLTLGPTSLLVKASSNTGTPLTGFCLSLYRSANGNLGSYVDGACDEQSGTARMGKFSVLTPGNYIIMQYSTNPKYAIAPFQPVTIVEGVNQATLVNHPGIRFRVYLRDERGERLVGACVGLRPKVTSGQPTIAAVGGCDNDRDADGRNGTILMPAVAPGIYTLFESDAPLGYRVPAEQTVDLRNGPEGSALHYPPLARELRRSPRPGALARGRSGARLVLPAAVR